MKVGVMCLWKVFIICIISLCLCGILFGCVVCWLVLIQVLLVWCWLCVFEFMFGVLLKLVMWLWVVVELLFCRLICNVELMNMLQVYRLVVCENVWLECIELLVLVKNILFCVVMYFFMFSFELNECIDLMKFDLIVGISVGWGFNVQCWQIFFFSLSDLVQVGSSSLMVVVLKLML